MDNMKDLTENTQKGLKDRHLHNNKKLNVTLSSFSAQETS